MTQSFIQPGSILNLAAPYDRLTSGLGAMIGSIFGVSCDTVLSGAQGDFQTEGVHYLLKTSAQAWALGDKLYWNASTKLVDNVPTTGPFIGYATAAAADPSASGYIKLAPGGPLLEGVQAAVADLTGTLTGTANGSLVDVAAAAGACAGGATPTAAQVDTAIATAVATIVSGTNEQLKEIATKLHALLASLRVSGLITP